MCEGGLNHVSIVSPAANAKTSSGANIPPLCILTQKMLINGSDHKRFFFPLTKPCSIRQNIAMNREVARYGRNIILSDIPTIMKKVPRSEAIGEFVSSFIVLNAKSAMSIPMPSWTNVNTLTFPLSNISHEII